MKNKPIAYLFRDGEDKRSYEVTTLTKLGGICCLPINGIIWLRQPTFDERMSIVMPMVKGGFELIAEPFVKDEES